MIKLFESRNFHLFLVFFFFYSLWFIWAFGSDFGIKDIPSILAVSVITLVTSLLAISLPIYATKNADNMRKEEEDKVSSIAVSLYVGTEILDNVAEIDMIIENNKKTESEMPAAPNEFAKKYAIGGMWAAAAGELELSLFDKWHQNLVSTGFITKIPNKDVARNIRETYQFQDNLIKRLRRLGKLYFMLQTPPENVTVEFMQKMIDEKLMVGIDEILRDIDIYKKQAAKTTVLINKMIEPYGEKIEIVDYNELLSSAS